jgi:hypothetical protein
VRADTPAPESKACRYGLCVLAGAIRWLKRPQYSSYCLSRDGHAKWRGFRVDYATKSLSYRLPYLNPYLDYRLRAVLYHASKDTWEQSFSLNGVPVGRFRHRPLVPETVWVSIPRELYKRDCEVTLDIGLLAGDYAAVAGLRLYQLYPYKRQPGWSGGGLGSVLPAEKDVSLQVPSPVRSHCTVSYSVLTGQSVGLRIYDVQGRAVKELAAGEHRPGSYAVQWDGTDSRGRRLPAGAYLLRLTAGGSSQTRKVLLAD